MDNSNAKKQSEIPVEYEYVGCDENGRPQWKSIPVEEAYKKSVEATRSDFGKRRLELISPLAMEGLADVLTFGAKKYADHNWRKGMDWSRCIGSLKRHLSEFEKGIDIDPESGLRHIDHIACNAMFLSEYSLTHKNLDDRYKLNNKGDTPEKENK